MSAPSTPPGPGRPLHRSVREGATGASSSPSSWSSSSSPRPARLCVVGSLNADITVVADRFPAPGETVGGGPLTIVPGGKGANQAVAAARLGAEVFMIGLIGDDANGAMLRRTLRAEGVDDSGVALAGDVSSGSAVITVDPAGENTIVVSPGANGAVDAEAVRRHAAVIRASDCLCVGFEVPDSAVTEAARLAADAGVPVLLNPSPWRAVSPELIRLTDVLLVNEHELALLRAAHGVGGRLGPADGDDCVDGDAVADALAGCGIRAAVVTRGSRGCLVVERGRLVAEFPGADIVAVDSTGAGDAVTGAVATVLGEGGSLVDAARLAMGVAAASVTVAGAQASYPRRADLQAASLPSR
ncbi:ribokinase [Mycetocola reblochoni]|nr:ribokinase [Mycetocola reblochoni]RLP68967.1 ribokinase [Mycetocola reblochoni]